MERQAGRDSAQAARTGVEFMDPKQQKESFRRLLRDSATGLYYDGKGGWSKHHENAYAFRGTAQAVAMASRLELDTLELVLKFANSAFDISHPLRSGSANRG